MNEPGDGGDGRETFVERWSRLKQQSREAPASVATTPTAAAPASVPSAAPGAPPAVELPDLAQLDQDSDYSAFLTPGVDADLRRRALRQLFSSPKFNVFDGLDTYRDDFRNFAPLGDVVTADMRHHVERLAREAGKVLEASAAEAPPAPELAATAVRPTPASDLPVPVDDAPVSPTVDEHLDHRPG